MARILVVEDSARLAYGLRNNLEIDGHEVAVAEDGSRGLESAVSWRPDLVILDLMLPKMTGYEVLRALRGKGLDVPVLILSARGEEVDKVMGFRLGADDYVTKPFSPRELTARISAVLRRTDGAIRADSPPILEIGEVAVDTARREVRLRGDPVSLTAREFDLLEYLAENPGRALSRRQLLDGAWGYDWVGDERTVDVHVLQLRKKLGSALHVTTVRGLGYRLD